MKYEEEGSDDGGFTLYVQVKKRLVDLSDKDDPIKIVDKLYQYQYKKDILKTKIKMHLNTNEFNDITDRIGFYQTQMEPYKFLTVDKPEVSQKQTKWVPFRINFLLDESKRIYEREAYTLILLASDIGGFNGTIFLIPAAIVAIYSERMYHS